MVNGRMERDKMKERMSKPFPQPQMMDKLEKKEVNNLVSRNNYVHDDACISMLANGHHASLVVLSQRKMRLCLPLWLMQTNRSRAQQQPLCNDVTRCPAK